MQASADPTPAVKASLGLDRSERTG